MNRYISWHQEVEGLSNWKEERPQLLFLLVGVVSSGILQIQHTRRSRTWGLQGLTKVLSHTGLLCVSIAQGGLDDWNRPKKGRRRVQLKSWTSLVLKRDTAGEYLAFAFLLFLQKYQLAGAFLLGKEKQCWHLPNGASWTALPTCLTPWLRWQMQHRQCSSGRPTGLYGLAPACDFRWPAESSCEGRRDPPTNPYGSIGFSQAQEALECRPLNSSVTPPQFTQDKYDYPEMSQLFPFSFWNVKCCTCPSPAG